MEWLKAGEVRTRISLQNSRPECTPSTRYFHLVAPKGSDFTGIPHKPVPSPDRFHSRTGIHLVTPLVFFSSFLSCLINPVNHQSCLKNGTMHTSTPHTLPPYHIHIPLSLSNEIFIVSPTALSLINDLISLSDSRLPPPSYSLHYNSHLSFWIHACNKNKAVHSLRLKSDHVTPPLKISNTMHCLQELSENSSSFKAVPEQGPAYYISSLMFYPSESQTHPATLSPSQ